jgi:amidase
MDIAKLLSVIAGYDGLDPRMSPESPLRADVRGYASELSKFTSQKLNVDEKLGTGMRIGLLTKPFSISGTSEQVRPTVHAAATTHFTAATRGSMADLAVKGEPLDLLSHPMPHWQPRWPPYREMYELLSWTNLAVVNLLFWGTFAKENYSAAVAAKAH